MSTLKTDKLYSTDRSTESDENILLNDDGTTNLKGNTTVTGTCTATTFSGSGASLTNVPDSALSTVTASKLTGTIADARFPATLPAISGANLTGITSNPPGNRNLWINGDQRVAQRGAGPTSGAGYKTVDGWKIYYHNCGSAGPTTEQISLTSSDTGPWAKGFRKAYRVKTASSGGAANADGQINVQYIVEAQDLATSGWEYTSSSSKLTLSFWIRTNVANNVGLYTKAEDSSGNNMFTMETGDLTADTWTYVTKVIPGASNLVFNCDNGQGWTVQFIPFYGTNFSASDAVLNTWKSSDGKIKPTTDNWITSNNAYMDITGVQLEVADTATDFEHRSYGDELARCQRYYYMHVTHTAEDDDDKHALGQGSYYTSTEIVSNVSFPTAMRARPTLESTNSSTGGGAFVAYRDGTTDFFNLFYGNKMEYTHGEIHNSESSQISGTAGQGCLLRLNQDAGDGTKLAFTAEI